MTTRHAHQMNDDIDYIYRHARFFGLIKDTVVGDVTGLHGFMVTVQMRGDNGPGPTAAFRNQTAEGAVAEAAAWVRSMSTTYPLGRAAAAKKPPRVLQRR